MGRPSFSRLVARPGPASSSDQGGAGLPKFGDLVKTPGPTLGPTRSGGGGFFHEVGHALGLGAHVVAEKADLAAHDIKGMPGGLIDIGKATAPGMIYQMAVQGHRPHTKIVPIAKGYVHQSVHALEHPLADPFLTALTVAPLASGAAKVGLAARAASAGDVAGAARVATPFRRIPVEPRALRVTGNKAAPVKGGAPGEVTVTQTHDVVPLHASTNAAARVVQHAYGAVIQKALDEKPGGRVAAHANRRIAGARDEGARRLARQLDVNAGLVDRASRSTELPKPLAQAAVHLTSVNNTAEEASRYHLGQAAKGVSPETNTPTGELYRRVAETGAVVRDAKGNAVIDAKKFPKLAALDARVAAGQNVVDQIARKHGLMTGEGQQARINGPARIRAGGRFDEATGVVGGESARPGRTFTSLKTSVKRPRQSAFPVARGPVVGAQRSFIASKRATYSGLEKGLVPEDTTGLAAQNMRAANRYVVRADLQQRLLKGGSDVSRTDRDVLVRDPSVPAAEIPAAVRQRLGTETSTLAEPNPEIQSPEGFSKFEDFMRQMVPGLRDNFADRAEGAGELAPKGYKWVHEDQLGMLREQLTPRGRPAKAIDTVNSAITAMTVYFKPGHIATRGFTNAATTVIQGIRPHEVASSFKLWNGLSDEEKGEALAVSGQHGTEALPHEGTGWVARRATKGAQWWARRIDAPFRFHILATEAYRAGFRTSEEFRTMLRDLKHQDGLDAARVAKVDWVAKRANRAGIMYDGLSAAERRYIARGFWFYAWVKGATRFAGHTVAEHPVKAAAIANLGAQGRKNQFSLLGAVPSYEQGLVGLGRGRVTDLSTFTPYGSAADVAETVARPSQLFEFANPVVGGVLAAHAHPRTPVSSALSQLLLSTPEAQIVQAGYAPSGPNRMFPGKTARSSLLRALLGPEYPRVVNRTALNRAAARERAGR